MRPLAIDLFCGLGGWTDGLLAEGYDVIGFDIEQHEYGEHKYPAQLVIQDVLTLHGSQFKDAALIVASPPCQEFSYMAMPWSRAKAKERDLLEGRDCTKRLTALFDACFRIQHEACEAAGRYIPLVVENVRGAQKWVGRSRWNFGSFHLWGDVPALMPMTVKRGVKSARPNAHGTMAWTTGHLEGYWDRADGAKVPGFRFDGESESFQSAAVKVAGLNWSGSDKPGCVARAFNDTAIKNTGGSWFNVAHNTTSGKGNNPVRGDGLKQGGDWFRDPNAMQRFGSKSSARKAASAMIAKIPFELSRYIAAHWKPEITT